MSKTNDTSVMKSLGINPGKVNDYSNVSIEPTSFRPTNNLGWGQEWVAEHSASQDLWKGTDREKIAVDGHTIVIKQGRPENFKALSKEWKEQMDEEGLGHLLTPTRNSDLASPEEAMARRSRGRAM